MEDTALFLSSEGNKMALGLITSSLGSFIENRLGHATPLTSMIVQKITATAISEKFPDSQALIASHMNHSEKTQDKYYIMKKKVDKAPLASAKIHEALRQDPIDLRVRNFYDLRHLLLLKSHLSTSKKDSYD